MPERCPPPFGPDLLHRKGPGAEHAGVPDGRLARQARLHRRRNHSRPVRTPTPDAYSLGALSRTSADAISNACLYDRRGDCRRCARVALLNVQIDGSRATLGRATPDDKGGPLVMIGNNEGQRVERCVLKDPRGWAAVHVREGDDLRCIGASVTWNEIVSSPVPSHPRLAYPDCTRPAAAEL